MTAVAATDGDFSVGRVVRSTFGVIGRNAPVVLALTMLALVPVIILDSYSPTAEKLSNIVWSVFGCVLEGSLIRATIDDLTGRKASLGASLQAGARYFWAIIGLSILSSLGILLGLLALIVPGIVLCVAWIVAIPVKVEEDLPLLECFSRSRGLTKGYRWPIFGMMVGMLIIAVLVVAGIALASMAVSASETSLAQDIVSETFGAVLQVFMAVGTAVIYYELRSIKEGIGPEQVGAVFD